MTEWCKLGRAQRSWVKLQQKLNYLYCPITIACFPWVEFHTFQGNNLAAKPAKKSNHPPPPHFSCLWYSLSKISFINLLFSIDRSYILDVFAALFYSKINSPQITSGLIISNSVLFFECCTFLSPLPFAAWTSPGFSFSRLILQDLFLQPF